MFSIFLMQCNHDKTCFSGNQGSIGSRNQGVIKEQSDAGKENREKKMRKILKSNHFSNAKIIVLQGDYGLT